MKKLLTALALTACTVSAMAQAAAPAAAASGAKQGPCGIEAQEKGLTGEARKAFIAECRKTLKAKREAERKAKREACTAEVKGKQLAGTAARDAMKACMAK